MSKDFDTWNNLKKQVHEGNESKFYHVRDVWWCALGLNVGYEQDGTGKTFERPVVVVRGFSKDVCLIVPLTTSTKKNKYMIPVGIVDGKEAQAIISQIRLVDTRRLINKTDVLKKEHFKEMKKAIKELL